MGKLILRPYSATHALLLGAHKGQLTLSGLVTASLRKQVTICLEEEYLELVKDRFCLTKYGKELIITISNIVSSVTKEELAKIKSAFIKAGFRMMKFDAAYAYAYWLQDRELGKVVVDGLSFKNVNVVLTRTGIIFVDALIRDSEATESFREFWEFWGRNKIVRRAIYLRCSLDLAILSSYLFSNDLDLRQRARDRIAKVRKLSYTVEEQQAAVRLVNSISGTYGG